MTETRETESNSEYVTLTDRASNKSVDLPLLSGTEGPKVIDIRRLYATAAQGWWGLPPSPDTLKGARPLPCLA